MIDYHIHTHQSIDAEGTFDEYCRQAIKLGLSEICFTNHCELDPARNDSYIRFGNKRMPLSTELLKKAAHQIIEAKKRYRRAGLVVKLGIEVGYYQGIENILTELLKGIELDFILGSIHCLDHICIDSSKEHQLYFSKHGVDELLINYYQEIKNLISSNLFDSLGHLDVYKKYGIGFYGHKIADFPKGLLIDCFKLMAKNNLALEINTAGLKRIGQFYISPSMLRLAREAGVKFITIGSDAHRVADLGYKIKEAAQYARSYGFDTVCGFDKRRRRAQEFYK